MNQNIYTQLMQFSNLINYFSRIYTEKKKKAHILTVKFNKTKKKIKTV